MIEQYVIEQYGKKIENLGNIENESGILKLYHRRE